MPQSRRTTEIISSASTPASRNTPETLRTLELNWRERRRAKLEDITLQRAMGVETHSTEAPQRQPSATKQSATQTLLPGPLDAQDTRGTKASSPVPTEDNIAARAPKSVPATHQRPTLKHAAVNRLSSASQSRPTFAFSADDTTYQTRTNRARKIVKLVRDARHSVQAGHIEVKASLPSRERHYELKANEILPPLMQRVSRSTADPPEPKEHHSGVSVDSKIAQPPKSKPIAVSRRVCEIRSGGPSIQTHERNSPRCSVRSFSDYRTRGATVDDLRPITASPLPSREYPLTPTSALIIYPYGQDWSIDLQRDDNRNAYTQRQHRRQPILSVVTASERMDILDEGKAMRIKPTSSNPTGSRQSRYLELRHALHWDSSDRRRWLTLTDLIQRLKAKIRKSTIDFPQGSLHIMCNDPPDIVFYTNIVESPPVMTKRSKNGVDGENTCDTSALLSATTDTFHLCRSRLLCSPSQGILKLSTRYGPSFRERHDRYDNTSLIASDLAFNRSRQSFRSRRIIDLSTTASIPMIAQVRELYARQKAALLSTSKPDSFTGKKDYHSAFPQEVWQAREVQTLGRFLKLEDAWSKSV
ncbi:hypothetical protein NliqN6_2871 [Naganishia liquefaciens]|uniref:Uncharacterized protein n=1 Tax=Naganishia liquefaciens TaxID=104408 RepID=A0A8H3YEH1_9TREE|nr:hypothetical protein NliqN6_2871 [Naganishia liquefaciens]